MSDPSSVTPAAGGRARLVPSGLFVTFEGGDGSGKTTQIRAAAAWLRSAGYDVVETREPGGTEVGRAVREMVLHHPGEIAPRAESLLYAADRAQHIATVVRPALNRGAVVLQDRYLDSSAAYQGAGRQLEPGEVRALSLWASEDLLPDLTLLLDLDEKTARSRLAESRSGYDRLEAEHEDFHRRVRQEYLRIAAAEPERIRTIDADREPTQIEDEIRALIAQKLSGASGDDGDSGGASDAGAPSDTDAHDATDPAGATDALGVGAGS